MLIDHFVAGSGTEIDGVRLAAVEFLSCGIFTLIPMFALEAGFTAETLGRWAALFTAPDAWGSILYAGVLSCGVAYTLQIVGQRNVQPTLASLLMSFESVFCLLGGWLILSERLSVRQGAGCILVFAAILLAQFGELRKKPV